MINELEQLNADVQATKDAFKDRASKLFASKLQELFDQFPSINSISWNQYTPYWCDGGVCEFAVNDNWTVTTKDDPSEEIEPGCNVDVDRKIVKNWGESERPATDVDLFSHHFSKLIFAMDTDLMKAMFGDHTQVTIKHTGEVSTDECEHE